MKKKFNKKLLMFGILGIFVIALVSAGLLTYYGQIQQEIEVKSPIIVSPDTSDIITNVWAGLGGVREGEQVTIENVAPFDVEVEISNNAPYGIEVSYLGNLDLSNKNSEWLPIGDIIEVEYTIIGDTFEITGVPEGYTAIYYKDIVVGLEEREANPQPAISIVGVGNLPHVDDANMDELANYCQAPDNYNQCKGAKLWVVPNEDLSEGVLNWANMANYYYELDLIQYNAEGNIVMYGDSELVITPVYTIASDYISDGVVTITTEVLPA